MAAPPFEAGAVKLTLAWPFPFEVAVMPVGAPGTTAAMVSVMEELVKVAWVGVLESVPETVKVKVPAVVGVPVITPVAAMESPAGRVPLAGVIAKM